LSILDSIFTSTRRKEAKAVSASTALLGIEEIFNRYLSKTGGHLSSNLGAVELTVACTGIRQCARPPGF
jgi:deoxyxylulose-5-phosphate synthase